MNNAIRWPERFDPQRAPIFVSNEITADAPAATVWEWLITASLWPTYYTNSSGVEITGGGRKLAPNARFRWKTFGVQLDTTIEEFEPTERIAWRAIATGVDAYHAWLITPLTGSTCHILTQETQYGSLARLGKLFMPNRMHKWHQVWLEELAAKAKSGRP